jgi:polyadenylation factor subunit 2
VLIIADILLFSFSGGNDHATRFWCRNRPGDTSRDKFNGGQFQGHFDLLSAYSVFD